MKIVTFNLFMLLFIVSAGTSGLLIINDTFALEYKNNGLDIFSKGAENIFGGIGHFPAQEKKLDTITVSKTLDTGDSRSYWTAEVQCPSGTKVTGGGYEIPETNFFIRIFENKPFDNGWRVVAIQDNGPDHFLTVYAQCGKLVN